MVAGAETIELNGEPIGIDEAGRRARELADDVRKHERSLLDRRVRLGSLLREVKKTLPHGRYQGWLLRFGINRHTAKNAVRVSADFAGEDGGPDAGRMAAARDNAVRDGRVPADHPIATTDPSRWSLRQGETVAGRRSVAPVMDPMDPASWGSAPESGGQKVTAVTFCDETGDAPASAPAPRELVAVASGEQLNLDDLYDEAEGDIDVFRANDADADEWGEIAARHDRLAALARERQAAAEAARTRRTA